MPASTRLLLVALCLLLVPSCSGPEIGSDYDPSVDFSVLTTYAWIPRPPTGDGDPNTDERSLLAQRVVAAANDALQAKGMIEVALDEASVLVTWHMLVRAHWRVNTTSYGYTSFNRWGQPPHPTTSTTSVRQYDRGTLMIDLVDPVRDVLIWRGTATSRVRDARTPEEREREVRASVDAILAQFPPGASRD